MEHAWLDSLSEDWVSQAGSQLASPSTHMFSPPKSTKRGLSSSRSKGSASRLPRSGFGTAQSHSTRSDSSNILSERSMNDINIPLSHRGPSKLSQEFKTSERDQSTRRSVSVSTTDSVIHNTVDRNPSNAFSSKRIDETPEWKRRLMHGDLGYGEQRDLFSSAATGLENMFRRPVMADNQMHQPQSPVGREDDSLAQREMLSSSDASARLEEESAIPVHIDESVAQKLPAVADRPRKQPVQYRLNEESTSASLNRDTSGCIPEQAGDSQISSALSAAPFPGLTVDDALSRKVSGQSVLRNEDFSPIVLTHRDATGAPRPGLISLDVQPQELKKRLEKLRRNQIFLAGDRESVAESSLPSTAAGLTNFDNTRDFERGGGFINFRRGGQSAEGSFQHRPLSPPLPPDTSDMLPEESLQASTPKQFPTTRTEQRTTGNARNQNDSPPLPRAPHPSPEKKNAPSQAGGGSPLKLFGPYDTFTNQTLMRRISQYEDQVSRSSEPSFQPDPNSIPESTDSQISDENFVAGSQKPKPAQVGRSVSARFGAGELDGYAFTEDISVASQHASDLQEDVYAPSRMQQNGGIVESSKVDLSEDATPAESNGLFVARRRDRSESASIEYSAKLQMKFAAYDISSISLPPYRTILSTPQRRDPGSESKRPRTSPSKDPTPKRRRTLHKSDIAYAAHGPQLVVDSVQSSHQQMQSVMARKRRDAQDGSLQQLTNPTVLAHRLALRPRTPTPSQRSSTQREAHPFGLHGDDFPAAKPFVSTIQQPDIVQETDRKPSIRTEDFINEANKIMAIIRNRAGIQSGLASVEESDLENGAVPPDAGDDSVQDSTKEPLSRPPSRDGRSVPRVAPRQADPELIARLKKYEERSDMGDVIQSSTHSMSLAQDAIRAAKHVEGQIQETLRNSAGRLNHGSEEIISDPPNIRISMHPARIGGHENPSLDGFHSQGSSSGNSTGRSIPTASSRGSESRRTIAPETVSHLIPDQVGNMFLDRQRNIWIKSKHRSPVKDSPTKEIASVLQSENSEDDPFADIPDLSVDMTMEQRNLIQEAAAARQRSASPSWDTSGSLSQPRSGFAIDSANQSRASAVFRDGGDADYSVMSPSRIISRFAETSDDEVEHEIGIQEDRRQDGTPRRKNLTISFSSPIASIIQDAVSEDLPNPPFEAEANSSANQPAASEHGSKRTRGSRRVSTGKYGSAMLGPGKPVSVRGQAFVPRPVSRIDERDEESASGIDIMYKSQELSLIGDDSVMASIPAEQRRTSVSFLVTTPARPAPRPVPHPESDTDRVLTEYVGMLSLTPLSEFTIHDQSMGLEASYVLGNRHLITGDGAKRIMSQTLRDLVDRLTEVEPFLPHWEEMEQLDIHDKRLTSLHMLDEFCSRLVTLDASDNAIRNASGIPCSVRNLKIVHNQLSELTAWGHLANLQYLDISNNDIKTLSGFKNLVHLRSLKADNCNLQDLNGIQGHDALQILRARNNRITHIDFDGTKLQRLTELDVEGNEVTEVLNLDQLSNLSTLNLQRNSLSTLLEASTRPLQSLRVLKLSDNNLKTLDVSRVPLLHILYADRNQLSSIEGFSKTPRLDSLSLREQSGTTPLDVSKIYCACEVRKLYLSGNLLQRFEPSTEFLNLQLLEMANCGIEGLAEDFGQLMPNLRKINLNFNAMTDLKCLRYISRLKKLLLAGNRLSNSLSTVEVLTEFPFLVEADLRDNPITQGFYGPLQALISEQSRTAPDLFTLPDADAERDLAYCNRLDLGTGMRRRIYETIYGESCSRLKKLDGLPLRRGIGKVRDTVWMALATRGVLESDDGTLGGMDDLQYALREDLQGPVEERWAAEDSFA